MYSTSHLYDILSKIRLYYSRLIQSKACVYKDNVGRDLQYRMGNLCMLIVCCYSWAWEKGKYFFHSVINWKQHIHIHCTYLDSILKDYFHFITSTFYYLKFRSWFQMMQMRGGKGIKILLLRCVDMRGYTNFSTQLL